ncbi:hypothetical protein BS50DRAFT_633553 [Corynespora cassiicola Philippines]|uniref:Uncharacterized protein n=1 Tax=Corynespora cassiicola Philippines TaxID=1448308 RepID=A0A2T2NR25_CORCC|nr:hypothetical protein BS50DRAFT_633553 [Corynespora cassiicola Philippines]
MSYMIQFRNHGPLPERAQTPPYILIGINGQGISKDLPAKIPQTLVFHFIPKLRIWELPDMSNQSLQAARASLTEPHAGVNILENIEVKGFKWIICRVMQLGGLFQPKENFLVYPGLLTSLSIGKAWLALDLPPAGIEALGMQDLTRLWFGQPISPSEMEILWESYPANSVQITSMGGSYLRGISSGHYTNQERARVCAWYQGAEDREEFFKELDNKLP